MTSVESQGHSGSAHYEPSGLDITAARLFSFICCQQEPVCDL